MFFYFQLYVLPETYSNHSSPICYGHFPSCIQNLCDIYPCNIADSIQTYIYTGTKHIQRYHENASHKVIIFSSTISVSAKEKNNKRAKIPTINLYNYYICLSVPNGSAQKTATLKNGVESKKKKRTLSLILLALIKFERCKLPKKNLMIFAV